MSIQISTSTGSPSHYPSGFDRPAPTRRRGRRALGFLLAGSIVVSGAAGAIITSGAYFTNTRTIDNNTITAATIVLGAIGDTGNADVAAGLVLPIPAGTQSTNALVTTVNIRNAGTAAFNWDAAVINVKTSTGPADSTTQVQVQASVDNGTNWTTPTSLAAFATAGATGAQFASSAALAPGAAAPLQLRMWLPASAGNPYQSMKITFSLAARAIQSSVKITDVPSSTFNQN